MNVLVVDLDSAMQNLAVMKLTTHHRAIGDRVELRKAGNAGALQPRLDDPRWDRVYGSLIFRRTRPLAELAQRIYPGIVLGGTGWDLAAKLPPEIEALKPDYFDDAYARHTDSIGFTQRGCRMECSFCVVPDKEGKVQSVGTLGQIYRGAPHPKHITLLDNDFFGNPHWRDIIDEAKRDDYAIAVIQGINARMLSPEAAEAIASVRWMNKSFTRRRVYTAWDGRRDEKRLFRGLDALVKHGISPDSIMVYMLIGHEPGETHADRDHRRARLRAFGCRPYPMPFTREGALGAELVAFQRWVIQRVDLHKSWAEFWGKAKGEPRKLGSRCVSLPLFDE